MRAISIGVQAAAMIDCDARVPLLVYAKRHKIDVKGGSLAQCRRAGTRGADGKDNTRFSDENGVENSESITTRVGVGYCATLQPRFLRSLIQFLIVPGREESLKDTTGPRSRAGNNHR
jgi:hypothetical protein